MTLEEISVYVERVMREQVNHMLGDIGKDILKYLDLERQFDMITESSSVFDKWIDYNRIKYDDAMILIETAISSRPELDNMINSSDKRTAMMFVVLCEMADIGIDISDPINIKGKML